MIQPFLNSTGFEITCSCHNMEQRKKFLDTVANNITYSCNEKIDGSWSLFSDSIDLPKEVQKGDYHRSSADDIDYVPDNEILQSLNEFVHSLLFLKADGVFLATFDGDPLHWATTAEISDINSAQISWMLPAKPFNCFSSSINPYE